MIIIKDLSDIESADFTLGEKFKIEKGNTTSYWDIRESKDYHGAYDLTRYIRVVAWMGEFAWRERSWGGSFTILGCAKMAYAHT